MMLRPFARAFVLSLAGLVGLGSADILVDGTAKYLPGAAGAGYEAGGIWRTALTDVSGSAILYVDTAGVTSGLVNYDPYGVPRTGSSAMVGIGYAGEYRDATGLINLRARSYDPVLGRFTGRDTFAGVASAPQTGNRYSYAVANPLRFADPSGRFVKTVIDNPASVLEFAITFNPIGAALVFGYMFFTGTDPATGEHVDTTLAGIALIAVTAVPVLKFLGKGLGALTRGLGEVGGATFGRIGELGGSIGRGLGRIGDAVGGFAGRVGRAIEPAGARARSLEEGVGEVGALERASAGRSARLSKYTIEDLGPNILGATDPVTGKITLSSRLPAGLVDSTLRHELVHQRVVRNAILGPVSRLLYNRSAIWTYA